MACRNQKHLLGLQATVPFFFLNVNNRSWRFGRNNVTTPRCAGAGARRWRAVAAQELPAQTCLQGREETGGKGIPLLQRQPRYLLPSLGTLLSTGTTGLKMCINSFTTSTHTCRKINGFSSCFSFSFFLPHFFCFIFLSPFFLVAFFIVYFFPLQL